ncbi:MAG TPA: hypothetical protein VEI03_20000 [Stellaceae bacterium]|nr:hypothetical protein [Stellaceae bacterium]
MPTMPSTWRRNRQTGGIAPPAYLGASPQAQQLYQRYASLPLDKLQQMAVMVPPSSPQGQMIRKAMTAKQLAPAATNAFPAPAPMPVPGGQGAAATPAAPPQARGGGIRRFDGGGSTGGAGGAAPAAASAPDAAFDDDPWTQGGGWTTARGSADAPQWTAGSRGRAGFPSLGSVADAQGGFPSADPNAPYAGAGDANGSTASGGGGYIRGAYGTLLPVTSFSAGNPGELGPSWSPGQALLTPSSAITAAPSGFGGTPANPPAVTPAPTGFMPYDQPPPPPPSPWSGSFYNGVPIGGGGQKRGGVVPRRAGGGPNPQAMAGVAAPGAMGELYHPGGFLQSPVAGRTDHLPLAVPADSHVIPADVVSGIGEGNSLNGAHLLDTMFHNGRWGAKAPKARAPSPALFPPPRAPQRAAGGPPANPDRTTSILAAGGEYVVRPEAVEHFGAIAKRREPQRHARKSAMQAGHDVIDDFIVKARKHIVRTMKRLPGPVKS